MDSKITRKKKVLTRRAWNFLRLALLWARKGGVFKRGLITELRLLPDYIKSLCHTQSHRSLKYQERELSFDETPFFRFKMHKPNSMRFHLPNLPCIRPSTMDFDCDLDYGFDGRDEDYGYEVEGNDGLNMEIVTFEDNDDKEIDSKAEEFITKFHEQMKLQRQVSYLQYKEMLNRSTN